ncbi:MAG: SGNH/GDSL hydrolase family protein [Candidatus Omnitrophica bacterium]|nr:SGNH/GDSL hydrolase family protein [Candidatus Omnitrophota bacterium]
MKNKKILFSLVAIIGGLLLTLLVIEIILRILGFGNLVIYQYDKDVYWKPRPNQHCFTKEGHQPVQINRLGLRGQEVSLDKPQGTFRILSLGDSRTFGWGVADNQTYSYILQEELSKRTGKNIEVLNAGVNGYSYPQMYVVLRDMVDKFDIDAVIVGSSNWWSYFIPDAMLEYKRAWQKKIFLKNIVRRFAIYHTLVELKLRQYYVRWRKRFIPVSPEDVPSVLDETAPSVSPNGSNREKSLDGILNIYQEKSPAFATSYAVGEYYLKEMAKLATEKKVPCVFLYIPHEKSNDNSLHLVMKRRVEQEFKGNVFVLDSSKILNSPQISYGSVFLEGDRVHMNAYGHEKLAEFLAGQIINRKIVF